MTELRCAVQSLALGESPLGSAGHDPNYLLVELPLPWPAKIEEHPMLDSLRAALGKHTAHRMLAVLADGEPVVAPDGSPLHRVIGYRGGDGSTFEALRRRERAIPQGALAEVLGQVIAGDWSALGPERPADTHDVLICTHGIRDRCCGTDGARLFLDLAARQLPSIRLWRTSHTGGHRFAPVALSFPDGITWGRIDGDTLAGALTRRLHPAALVAHNRGSVGFTDPRAQAADSTALATVGWAWLDGPRTATIDEPESVTIAGPGGRYRVLVQAGEPIPVPPCGEPLSESRKTTTPLRLDGIEALPRPV